MPPPHLVGWRPEDRLRQSSGRGKCRVGYGVRMDLIRLLFAIVLPPLGVFLQVGLGKHFWINVLLTLLGYFPGIIHAIYVILKVGPERPRIRPAFH